MLRLFYIVAGTMAIGCAQGLAWDEDVEEQNHQASEQNDPQASKDEKILRLCHEILEIERNARPKEIKKAYGKLSQKYHPDKNPGKEPKANTITLALNGAKEILDNPEDVLSDDTTKKHDIEMLNAGLNAKKDWTPSRTR